MTKARKFILNTFLKLTSMTCPYGHEDALVRDMTASGIFPSILQKDSHGNYFAKVGDSKTIFASHLDTVSKSREKVTHKFEGDMIKTAGNTTLGADDKAGVAVMLWMMAHNVPGLYYFFVGEEVGCIGSGKAASSINDFKGKYDRIISFDRRGTGSVITHQSWSRCCSDAFGDALAGELNKSGLSYKKDDGGVYTDSAEFVDIIPECTNLSVGYYKEHTFDESQDIAHLTDLAEACLRVDWESLPTQRDPGKYEAKGYSSKDYGYSSRDYGYGDWSTGSRGKRKSKKHNRGRSYGFHDDWESDDWGRDARYDSPGWDDDWSEWESIETQGAPKGKQYYDSGSGIVEIKTNSSHYEWVMSKFVGCRLTASELMVIRDQYLDMNNPNDFSFYEYLVDYVAEGGIC
jgi:hypothetical protein